MSTIEPILLFGCLLGIVYLFALTFDIKHPPLSDAKFSRLPTPKNYPPYRIRYDHKIFENNSWTTAICYGTSDEIAEQMSEWDKITNKNLAEYEKSAKMRGMISLRKKLKEKCREQYCK